MNERNLIQKNVAPTLRLVQNGILQRRCACGNHTVAGGKCEDCAKRENLLERKLTIGTNNDLLEQDANWVADQVLAAHPHSAINTVAPRIQRYTGHEIGEAIMVPASLNRVLASPGTPLDPALQQDMGQRFGYDFSRVRVHSNAAAVQSAKEVDAHAYTVGHNIVFGIGQFAPLSHEGRRLLAHELTHVVQQSSLEGSISPPIQRKEALTPTTTQSSSTSIKRQQRQFKDRLNPATNYVNRQYAMLRAKTRELGLKYHEAWVHYTKALDDAKQRDEGVGIIDSALAFIPGGIAGVVGKWITNIKYMNPYINAFIADGVKDLVKITMRLMVSRSITESEGVEETLQEGRVGSAFTATSEDDFTWRDKALIKVDKELSIVSANLEVWGDIATKDATAKNMLYDWDPYAFVQEAIRINKTTLTDLPDPTEKHALLFEKGFWKEWIEKNRYYLIELYTRSGKVVNIADRTPAFADVMAGGGMAHYFAGQRIRKRINDLAAQLGEDGEVWLKQWGIESLEKLEAEKVKMNEKTFGATIYRGLSRLFGEENEAG